ncbi:hypothetical protein Y032_0050g2051 [Ancylostoma ceylanicum]|uniref:SCP domain-containing protein n=1 Tax=Ancylostoma ceylanicum TaxID=53326 RepID=A0A016U9T0_9BILA|nr:hypothetical protein Y032_0050g2051 [Ancylostoma ceylanicum]
MRLIIALLAVTFAATAQVRAQSFGCGRDLKIDDKLRKQFLDFHNQKRMNVAKGAEGKFKSAKNMYKAYLKGKILYDSGRPCTKSDECMTYRGSSCDARTGLCVKPEEKPDDMKSTVCPKGRGMTDKMRNTILDLHNDFRSLVARGKAEDRLVNNGKGFAPQGASMLRMEYNCDLEKTAADYAARCIYAHSQPYERDNAGENLYTVSIDNADKNKAGEWATRGWFSELKEFGVGKDNLLSQWLWDRPKRQNNPEIKIGHYTQMVWGTTSKIGCGIQNCPGVQTLVVCHYKDAGNVLTNPPRQIYEVGQVCSHCPNGYSCDKDMLCAKRTR